MSPQVSKNMKHTMKVDKNIYHIMFEKGEHRYYFTYDSKIQFAIVLAFHPDFTIVDALKILRCSLSV